MMVISRERVGMLWDIQLIKKMSELQKLRLMHVSYKQTNIFC